MERIRAGHFSCHFRNAGLPASLRSGVQQKHMGWATVYIDLLRKGETVQFRPRGNSMAGKIESGQLCTVTPVSPEALEVGEIKAKQGDRFQIGNNRGRINGWIGHNGIYGKCVRIE